MPLRSNLWRRAGRSGLALAVATSLHIAPLAAACVPASGDAMLILDLSYSMLRSAGNGMSRFHAAREAINTVAQQLPNDARVALRFYGSEAVGTLNTCSDSILAVPFARADANRAPIRLALAAAHARGRTPIAYALLKAVEDFGSGPLTRTIVLVSDGSESCGGDPCATAAGMAGKGFVINAVGFQADLWGRRQMECMAKATGGTYVGVPSPLQLADKVLEAFGICPIALAPLRPEDTARAPAAA